MDIPLPSRDALKAQAKRLRAGLNAAGTPCSHAQALETIAHQWGARDWNTLSARAKDTPQPGYHPGQRISGRYLGQPFVGQIKAASRIGSARYRLTLRFDTKIDVVRSALFSSWRQQVNCVVDSTGRSLRKTSDGMPHVVLDDAWSGG